MQFVSPRQLARAAGVSQSSVKRWCDQGLIETVKTAGGHRRLTLDAAAEFLRKSYPDARLDLLGLPARSGGGERTIRNRAEDFYKALISGNEEGCRQILLELHLAGERASRIFDAVVAESLRCVGAGWERGEVQVYQERRGVGICLRALGDLKAVIPPARKNAPLAIGAAPECDPYMLPTGMVEIVLRQTGWRSDSLGSRLPFATLLAAIRDARPRLFWLSVSHIDDEPRFLGEYRAFYRQIQAEVAVVVGGRALSESLRRQMEYTAYCDNLQHLEPFAKTLRRALASVEIQTSSGQQLEAGAPAGRKRSERKERTRASNRRE